MYWRRSTRPARPKASAGKVAAAAAAAAAIFPSPPDDRPLSCGAEARSLLVISSSSLGFLVTVESFAGSCAERRLIAGAVPPKSASRLREETRVCRGCGTGTLQRLFEDRGGTQGDRCTRSKQGEPSVVCRLPIGLQGFPQPEDDLAEAPPQRSTQRSQRPIVVFPMFGRIKFTY